MNKDLENRLTSKNIKPTAMRLLVLKEICAVCQKL